MAQLFLDQFRIDTQRCQVSNGDETVTLEPKVMKVFECLARHQGEVVSHATLLEEIWGNSVVDPSALQRCITQLRKAFHDDARQQLVIATYPKNGYCLLRPVTTGSTPTLRRLPHRQTLALAATLALAVTVVTGLLLNRQGDNPTAADEQARTTIPAGSSADFFAAYSPDGLRIAYPRQHENSQRLWVRNLVNGEEFLLAETAAAYAQPAWSPDGQYLAVLDMAELHCSNLLLLQVSVAGQETPPANTLLECRESLYSPQWLGKNELAYIDNSGPDSRIMRLNLQSRQTSTLYSDPGRQLQYMNYSERAGRLAVSIGGPEQRPQIMLLGLGAQAGSELTVDLPGQLREQEWRPIWNPQADGLIISTGSAVYNISLDGRLTQQRSPFLPENPSQH